MSLIFTDDEIESNASLTYGKTTCSRCDLRLVDVVFLQGQTFCFECSGIVRRGASIVIDYEVGKSKDKVINDLALACEAALLLRGITAAINDPLTLNGEKEKYRRRYIEIEKQILAAVENSKDWEH